MGKTIVANEEAYTLISGQNAVCRSLFLFQLIFVLIATVMPFLVVHSHYVFLVFSGIA